MSETEKDHVASDMSSSSKNDLVVVAFGNAFDGITLFGPFSDAEVANEWADRQYDDREWNGIFVHPVENGMSELSESLPEGLSPWRGKPGELEIQDAQGHVWVTLHAGANGDPIKWRNTITTAVYVALGINAREYAK